MKRLLTRFLCICMAAVFLIILSACSYGEKHTPYSISQKILELCSDNVEMTSLTAEQTAAHYGIPTANLHDFCVYICAADDQYDTVAVFSYSDKKERAVFTQAIADSLKTNETTVKAVNDSEYKKIQNRLIAELEDKLILVISDNVTEIEAMLKELGASNYTL